MDQLPLTPETVARRLTDLAENQDYHARAVQKIIEQQMAAPVVQQLNAAGGAKVVFEVAWTVIQRICQR